MASSLAAKRARFRELHRAGCFALPNPFDVGTAMALQSLGFSALASTSAGMAWSLGRSDRATPLEDALDHLHALAAAVEIPLNADFEGGYAIGPEEVALNVVRAAETGISGLSIEDSTGDPERPLFDFTLAVERIVAAHEALAKVAPDLVLTARSEGFISGAPDMTETLRRLKAYSEAGADCLYAPGIGEKGQIGAVVRELSPKPVNVLTLGLSMAELADLGVRRVSVGGALARVAWGGFLAAAKEIATTGVFTAFASGAPGRELNALFKDRI